MKRFQRAAEPWKTHIAAIAAFPRLPESMKNEFDAYTERNALSGLGRTAGNTPISLMQMDSSLNQFVKRIRQPNYSVSNKWKNIWLDVFLEYNLWVIIQMQIHLEQLRDGPLLWETVVASLLVTFKNWLQLEEFDNVDWIQ